MPFPGIKKLLDSAKRRDIHVISAFLKKGKDEGTLNISNLKRTTELLHDCLNGLRIETLTDMTNFFRDEKQFNDLLIKEKELTDMFFKALSI